MNPDLERLHPYPFERLAALRAGVAPPRELDPIVLSVGEPRHPTPAFLAEAVIEHLHGLASYPATRGGAALREAIAAWLTRRFGLPEGALDPERHVLPVNGTREALFALAQALVDRSRRPLVMMPNPFYQIYEGAALLAGAEPRYLPTTAETGWLPDLDAVPERDWARCQLVYVCSPGNPTGRVAPPEWWGRLLALAERHGFVVASDECYSEIYLDEARPPTGLLAAAHAAGREGFEGCLVLNSLSKRSNAPGLRSGLVAGDARLIAAFLRYRTYHGCAMPPPAQAASVAAWRDEAHVRENRARYRAAFEAVVPLLAEVLEDVRAPEGGFYLWPRTPVPDTEFARGLYASQNVTVLPGSFLSRPAGGADPGAGRVRIALVAPLEDCVEAARRIRDYVRGL
ncbi:MAG TPA: succinyldiaminopimelate transaminase [Chromatiales bacterium]|nr:succinyldiaminopimelate transaminase [Chromatiales bacterium]